MSQNLTQPEELERAQMEFEKGGMKLGARVGDIKYLNAFDQEIEFDSYIDPMSSLYGKLLKKTVQCKPDL